MSQSENTRSEILITVMTYPHPSRGYQELVCTAGVTREGEWVRLYPIDYRYRPKDQQFHKYQWISIETSPRGDKNDRRRESRKPNLESIKILQPPLSTQHGWAERRSIVDALPHRTVRQWQELYDQDKTSLGVVRPVRVHDMVIEEAEREWKPEWESLFQQMRLFGEPQKPLKKIPYKFSYVFDCEDSPKPHTTMCEDWELGVLFLTERERLGSEQKAAESVKYKFLNELCDPSKDTRFFMGTIFPYNSWVVLGVFYPPRSDQQLMLF
jgi:hypothetical protein